MYGPHRKVAPAGAEPTPPLGARDEVAQHVRELVGVGGVRKGRCAALFLTQEAARQVASDEGDERLAVGEVEGWCGEDN